MIIQTHWRHWTAGLALVAGLACHAVRADDAQMPPQYADRYATATADVPSEAPAVLQHGPANAASAERPLPLSPPAQEPANAQRARPMQPLVTGAASLGIVLGLFLLVVLVTKRGMPKGTAILPREVVEVLGRAPLVGRQQVHLVRCANKLLLVCAAPAGAHTLTEITDPAEVERLVELCQGPPNAAGPLKQLLGQFGGGPRERSYFGRHEEADLNFAHLESAHAGGRESRT
ncbi:MAG: flagellar biosynthetic protein FliO [Pirellulales bacterium]